MFNLRFRFRYVFVAAAVLIVSVVLVAMFVPRAHDGLVIARLKASGSLPEIGWKDLYRMVTTGRHYDLPGLVATPNPYAVIRNPFDAPEDLKEGRDLFRDHCSHCHGTNGSGGPGGPALQHRQMVHGDSDWAIFRAITLGIRGTAMPANDLPWNSTWQLAAYVRSLALSPVLPIDPNRASMLQSLEPIGYELILAADRARDSWLTYSGSYDSHRFSSNNQITPSNASGLRLLWMRQYNTAEPSIETSPLVVGDFMFVTLPTDDVEALDAKTGSLIWTYHRHLPDHVSLCCGYVNRGLAVLGKTLFLGTLDAHLVALDIATGEVRWDVEIADYKTGFSITGAPLTLKNLVITGVAGGEYGARGFITARDAATGNEAWRFDTIPQPGQPGADTWKGEAWKTGGGPAWLTGSYDPESNLVYWPTGNPSPNFEGDARVGENLYTNCLLALDADRGTLRWYFQFTPHDVFDWDATEIPVLLDEDVAGQRLRYVVQANRNGFFYRLDAVTGKFLLAKPFAKQTWASGIDSNGRPELNPASHPTQEGTTIYPGVGGAANWESPSYSPVTRLLYVPFVDWGGIFSKAHADYHPGELFMGGSFQFFANETAQGAVRALNPMTGETQWEYRNPATAVGGLLSTAGGVLFGSQDQNFFALDAKTGRQLWTVGTGGRIVAAPVTFLYHGRQLVTIAAGHDLLTFSL